MPAEMIVSSSPTGVKETTDSLQAAVESKGLTVFARIDHAAAAAGAGLEMPDEEVLVFGNPKAGTMLMKENPAIGLELPLKIVVWAGAEGTTRVGYTDPAVMAERYGITEGAAIIETVGGLLKALTS
jgi:uncharacterized protein (DUF302 family)